uniref:Uncharacterized protein n=1 Tax=Brassica oleracea var. oleracea TaxID=109376 RepID=A0A0D2ZQA7_BRAOL
MAGHCFLKLPPVSPIEDRGTAIPIEDRDRVIPERLRLCGVIVKGLPVSLVWRKNDFVGPSCKALSLELARCVNGRTGLGRGVKFVTLTGSSLARNEALPDHGVGLDGQSCSCLIVGCPVGLSSPNLGVGRPSVMFLFNYRPVGRPMLWTVVLVSIAVRDENLKVEGVRGQTQTRTERGETDSENWAVVWTGEM